MATFLLATSGRMVSASNNCSCVIDLSVKRIVFSKFSTATPLSLLYTAFHFSPSLTSNSPPAVYIQLVKSQPPPFLVLVSAKPATPLPAICFAYPRNSSHVVGGLSGSSLACLKRLRL